MRATGAGSASADTGHARCPRCSFVQRLCLCAEIPTIATRTQIVIVRHHREQGRSSNTGRLAHLALPNSVMIDHGAPGDHKGPGDRVATGEPTVVPALDGAWLVFPVGEPTVTVPAPPPRQLVVLDATWSQARRMYRKLDALRGLPILRLPDAPMPAARLRTSPGAGQVSTIEAIARTLRLLEGEHVAAPLEALFKLAVERAAASGRIMVPPMSSPARRLR